MGRKPDYAAKCCPGYALCRALGRVGLERRLVLETCLHLPSRRSCLVNGPTLRPIARFRARGCLLGMIAFGVVHIRQGLVRHAKLHCLVVYISGRRFPLMEA
jgi:hypothetical protein